MNTAEFVSPMHPDKICDRISSSILDECLKQDPHSRVAVETLGGHKKIIVMGEVTTTAEVDFKKIVQDEINDSSYEIIINIDKQSLSIAQGVNSGGAGDQGIMIGYACKDTENFMPIEYQLARELCQWIYQSYPNDGKVQFTTADTKVKTIIVSWCGVSRDDLEKIVNDWFYKMHKISRTIEKTDDYKLIINSSGDWNVGGFDADTGLTGRKIVIDAYGPNVSVGGGAFSGKDPTKVDLSGALMARKIAVELLNAFSKLYSVTVKVAYAIGKKEPIMLVADVVYTEPVADNTRTHFDILKGQIRDLKELNTMIKRFYPENIIKELDLLKPQYKELSKWGHFGNNNLWDE